MTSKIKNKEIRNDVETELSIHPEVQDRISKFQIETLKDEINNLPPIKEGDVNISTDYIFESGDEYEVSLFVRNGLAKTINFEQLPLILINSKNESVASKVFNLRKMGDIPPMSVRPWKIYFKKDEVQLGEDSLNDLKVVFDSKIKADNTVKIEFEELPEELKGENRRKAEKFLNELPLLRKGEVSISTYDVFFDTESGLSIVIVIRNGQARGVKLEELPICVKDAHEAVIAKGVFKMGEEGIAVSPSKAKICRFVFSKDEILVDKIDLNKWTVTFK